MRITIARDESHSFFELIIISSIYFCSLSAKPSSFMNHCDFFMPFKQIFWQRLLLMWFSGFVILEQHNDWSLRLLHTCFQFWLNQKFYESLHIEKSMENQEKLIEHPVYKNLTKVSISFANHDHGHVTWACSCNTDCTTFR